MKNAKENYTLLFNSKDIEKYIDSSIGFIEKDAEFRKLISSNASSTISRLKDLSLEISKLQNDFVYFLKLNQEEYKNPMETISYLILKYKSKFFNPLLKYDFFVPNINYLELINDIIYGIKSTDEEILKKGIFVAEKTNFEILKIILKVLSMISIVYKENGEKAAKKICSINKMCLNMNDEFRQKRNAIKTDLFNLLYGYNNFKKIKLMDDENDTSVLIELTDDNGVFKDLTEHEISQILYSYVVLYGNQNEILSNTDEHNFKDLSEIADIIKRGIKEGIDSSQIIDDLASGKRKITFSEQNSKHI